jgi:SAM-dependent methyltransferase
MPNAASSDDLLRIAHSRLVPSITNPNYLVLRRRAQIFREWVNRLPQTNLLVLDIGGRYQPYRPLLESRVKRYVALDILSTPLVHVIARGEQLPFRDASFDLTIATGVFEYFPEPLIASREIYRVLKPRGFLFMSVGSVAPRFVDEEHWRFMRVGLRATLSPFSQVEIVPEVFTPGGFCRMINAGLNIFAKYEVVRKLFQVSLFPLVNLIGLGLEGLALTTNDQLAGNYSAIARK